MNQNCIVMKDLNKFYGKKQALYDLNLTIEQGMFGLLGRNGAGKTTLMKTLATLLNKKSGSVTICGTPLENAKEIRKLVGYLPQEFSMYPGMTVTQAMDYLGVLSGMSRQERKARIPALLKRVNLSEQANKKVRALSGGMKRRLGIAQALLHHPKVLIVDEPTAGLDPEERIRFRNLLCEIAEDRIVLLSTHIVGDIEATCEAIAILNDGKLLYSGSVEELVESANGKVFTAVINKAQLSAVKKQYTVTGVLTGNGKSTVRLLADQQPFPEAQSCEPTIEDAYMHCLHQNGSMLSTEGGDL